MNCIHFYPQHARAVLQFAATMDVRYYLNSVLIEATPTETMLVGCDGHTIGVFRSTQANDITEPMSLLVPRAVIANLPKRASRKNPTGLLVQVEQTESGWVLRDPTQDVRFGFDPVGGKYPNWRKPVPKAASGTCAQLNPSYVARLAIVARILGRSPSDAYIAHNGESAAVCGLDSEPDFRAFIMPQRQAPEMKTPDWIQP